MKFTDNQRLAIEVADKDLLISASAGTGKTAVLIERVFRLIVEGGIDISRILVVTYTEKAARELKSRLAARLSSVLDQGEYDLLRIEEQIEKLEWADISTIHSFCKKIAVQNFSISKIDPSARVLDESEKAIMMYDAIRTLIREELSKTEPEPALTAYTKMTKTDQLSRILTSLYTKAAGYEEPRSFFIKALKASEGRALSSSLLRLALRMVEKYKAKKAESKLIDFDDMQYYALDALEDEAVRLAYRDAYDYIFVDEYQDTSYVQDRLITQIAKPGSLFIVGDYKQSIYGFRNARPELFLQKYEAFHASDSALTISLNENFRSEVQVIEAVNEVFSEIMTEDFGGIDYKNEAKLIYPAREEAGIPAFSEIGEDKRTRINFIEVNSDLEDGEDVSSEDYAYLCLIRRIKELKEELGYAYKDICILMRSPNKNARKIRRLFEEQGLSLSIDMDDDLLLYPEINTLLDYLKIVSNPFHDEAFIAVLRSPIGGFDDDELFELSEIKADLGLDYYADLFDYLDEKTIGGAALRLKLKRLDASLKKFREDESLLIRDRLLRLMKESDYLHYLLGRVAKEGLLSSAYEFLDFIYEFEKKNGSNLNLLVETYEDIILSDGKVKAKPTVKQAEDSVKLLSIHKSKGLQFKVVILFGMEKDFKKAHPSEIEFKQYAFDENGTLLLKRIEKDKGLVQKNPLIEEAGLKHKAAESLEEQRLFYVALTRAETKLEMVISGKEADFKKRIDMMKGYEPESVEKKPRDASSYSDFLISAIDFRKVYDFDFSEKNKPFIFGNNWEFCVITPRSGKTGQDAGTLPRKAITEHESEFVEEGTESALEQGVKDFREFDYPSVHLPVRRSVTSLKQAFQREDFDYHLNPISKDATRRGTVYHSFMQHFILNAKNVKDFLEFNAKKGFLTGEDLALIDLSKIQAFISHPIFERIYKAKRVWKEKAFIYQTEIDGKPTQIQGIIDLMFLENKRVVILDYKSDRLKKREDFIELYKTQLGIYAEAVSSITGMEVAEKLIYSFELGELIEV